MNEALHHAQPLEQLTQSILHWDLCQQQKVPLTPRIRTRFIGNVRLSEITGGPCIGSRGAKHRKLDGQAYIGIVCFLGGREICHRAGQQFILNEGDILIWHNSEKLKFEVPVSSKKLVLLVPRDRFCNTIDSSLYLEGHLAKAALVVSYMKALALNADQLDDQSAQYAVQSALDLISAMIKKDNSQNKPLTKVPLYGRILKYIEQNLQSRDLNPPNIALAHQISLRYLHLLFADHNTSVSNWIRARRLDRCKDQLTNPNSTSSLTELAYLWGFSDAAHFSRSFKKRFGLPPNRWKSRYFSNRLTNG